MALLLGRGVCVWQRAFLPGANRSCPYAPAAWVRLKRTAAQQKKPTVSSLPPNTSIDVALTAAADASGVHLEPDQLNELADRLKGDWYSTAGDVAAMSKQELQHTRIPVKLWAVLKSMVVEGVRGSTTASTAATTGTATSTSTAAAAALEASAAAEAGAAVLQQAQQQQALVEVDVLPADIMKRRMPQNIKGTGGMTRPVVKVRPALITTEPYALKLNEMHPELLMEMERLQDFSCGTFPGQRVEPLRAVSFDAYARELRQVLGYVHRVAGVPLDQLHLSTLLPSHEREGVSLLMQYQHWRQKQRGVAPRTLIMAIKATIVLARFLYHEMSQATSKPPYRDLPVMEELSRMLIVAKKAASGAPLVSDESKKWLTWAEYLDFVKALQEECAGLTATGQPRDRCEVAASLQRYLIAAILSVVPDRQRTLRELEVGRTLLQREDGSWVIKHSAADYKTGKQYGDRPPLVLAPFIYPELEAFIKTWRTELQPKTPCLFCTPRTGQALTQRAVFGIFRKAALRLTGKATNPHLVRDMIVTHLRQQGATELDMEALATLMAHSVTEQRRTYDRRTRDQKVRPAVDLMLDLSKGLQG